MKRNLRSKLTVAIRQLTTGARTSTFVLLSLTFILMACTNGETAHEHDTYTCPMHPTVISDRPGTCPVCGMDLVRKARPGEEMEITEDLSKLIKSPNETVVSSIRSVRGEYKSIPIVVPAQGIVTYDTRKIFTISARISGRLERVYLKYTFQKIKRGDKVAEIYSPEMIAAQRELLFLLEKDPGNQSLTEAARRKLELLGMSKRQIADLMQRRETKSTFTLYSPHSGYLITGQQTPSFSLPTPSATSQSGAMSGDGMGSASQAQASAQPQTNSSLMRAGQYVTAGQTMFTIVNNDALRIELSLPASLSDKIVKGGTVHLDFGNHSVPNATVDFVQPFLAQGENFVKVRLYTHETDELHIGHLVDARIRLESKEALWVPKEAVLDLGIRKLVFIGKHGVYNPAEVITGMSAEGMIEIKRGLTSSDEIAANAHFLVDSESFVKPSE